MEGLIDEVGELHSTTIATVADSEGGSVPLARPIPASSNKATPGWAIGSKDRCPE